MDNQIPILKKKYILVIAVLGFLLILAMAYFFLRKEEQQVTPTPTLLPTITDSKLRVDKINPVTDSQIQDPRQPVEVLFTQPINRDDIRVGTNPETPLTILVYDNKLQIKPQLSWRESQYYTVNIEHVRNEFLPFTVDFFSTGPTPTKLPDTFPGVEEVIKQETFERENHPDVYLTNKTPYAEPSFSVVSDFKKEPTGHYYFIVEISEGFTLEQGRTEFVNWLKTLQLTEQQINLLDIEYLEPGFVRG